jgi:hypothetical protein
MIITVESHAITSCEHTGEPPTNMNYSTNIRQNVEMSSSLFTVCRTERVYIAIAIKPLFFRIHLAVKVNLIIVVFFISGFMIVQK